MKNLKNLLKQPLQPVHVSAVVSMLILALVGFIDSTYLTIEHFLGVIPPCSLTGGCDAVLTSSYSTFFGIPVALFGSLYYVAVMIGILAYFESRNLKFLKFSMLLTIIGFLFSMWFVYLQVFVINSYCAYCLVSAMISTALFTISMYIFSRYQDWESQKI